MPLKRLCPTWQWVAVEASMWSTVPRSRHTIREPAAEQVAITDTYLYGMSSRGLEGAMFDTGSICAVLDERVD